MSITYHIIPLLVLQFNRCITSQLIKWFSNFREFYYIQMEKYARQAINDGVTSTDELSITRDCELYRALNMHYNKANDFEVRAFLVRCLQHYHLSCYIIYYLWVLYRTDLSKD